MVASKTDQTKTRERIAVIVAGSGEITYDHAVSLLGDWLRLKSNQPVDPLMILPITGGTYNELVRAAADLVVGYGLTCSIITLSSEDPEKIDKILTPLASCMYTVDSPDEIPHALVAALNDAKDEGYDPYVILAWGPEEDAPDPFTEKLLVTAYDAGFPILEIASEGLDELVLPTEEELEQNLPSGKGARSGEAQETEPKEGQPDDDEQPFMRGLPTEGEPEEPLSHVLYFSLQYLENYRNIAAWDVSELTSEVRAHLAQMRPDWAAKLNLGETRPKLPLKKVLSSVLEIVAAADLRGAALFMESFVDYCPLALELALHIAQMPDDPEPAAQAASRESVQQIGSPRPKDGEVAVLCDEEGNIIALAGRGRPRKGTVRKIVPRDQVPTHLLSA